MLAVDRYAVGRALDGTVVGPVIRVVLEEVRALRGADQIVDGGDLDLGVVLDQRLEKIAADPAEPVDPDAHGGSFDSMEIYAAEAAWSVTRLPGSSPL